MNMATLGHLIKVLKCRRLIDIDEKLIQMNLNCEIFLWQGKQAEHDGLTGKTAKNEQKMAARSISLVWAVWCNLMKRGQ